MTTQHWDEITALATQLRTVQADLSRLRDHTRANGRAAEQLSKTMDSVTVACLHLEELLKEYREFTN